MKNQIKNFLFLICMTLILSGCAGWSYEVPEDNVDFAKIERLSDLDGTYQNQSEGASGQPTYYLSSLIWPEGKIGPKAIETIEVKAITGSSILVKGRWGKKEVVVESILVEGQDFHLNSGYISIRQQVDFIPSETNIPGIYYNSQKLGLDEQGHGKLKESYFMTGLAVMIPFAFSGGNEVRFKRIK